MKQNLDVFRKRLGAAIAKQRELSGLTQEQVAEKLGIGNEAVSRIERGVVEPSAVRMMQLADIFNCSVTVFFEQSSSRKHDYLAILDKSIAPLSEQEANFVLNQAVALCQFLTEKNRQ